MDELKKALLVFADPPPEPKGREDEEDEPSK